MSRADFDLHGIVRMSVEGAAAPQLRDMFAGFLVDAVAEPNLTVDDRLVPTPGAALADDGDRFTATTMHLEGPKVQVEREGRRGFRVHGAGELLTTVLPLVDRVAVRGGAAMVHAATVEHQGHGVLLAGTGGAGKTSTVAKLVQGGDTRPMGDDWAFLSGDGRLLGFAKPLLVRPHHRSLYPHLFKPGTKKKPMIPPALAGPMGRLATAVHPTIVRYPRAARVLRRWSPEHMMVGLQEAFPQTPVVSEAPLGAAIFVERVEQELVTAEQVDASWMAARLLGNFHEELPRFSKVLLDKMCATGLDALHELFGEKERLLAEGLERSSCTLLRVPATLLADEASDVISAHVRAAVPAGVLA